MRKLFSNSGLNERLKVYQYQLQSMLQSLDLDQEPLILIYYNFKGMAHVSRHLLCYLNLPFHDVLLDIFQEQKQRLPANVLERLKGTKIDKNDLPILIHGEIIVSQLYPIMAYICRRFDREDLLGIDIYQKAQVQELIEVYLTRLPHTQSLIFGVAEQASKTQDNRLLQVVSQWFKKIMKQSGYMRELSEFLLHQQNPKFILENITILDFYFYESSNYMLGTFGSLDVAIAHPRWHALTLAYTQKTKVKGLVYLKTMNYYHHFMKSQPYYIKYQTYLQSFSTAQTAQLSDSKSEAKVKGMKRLWALD